MNRLANLALRVVETLVHEPGRLLFGIALGRAKELLGTPQQLGTRQLALHRALQKKAVDGALLAGSRTGKEYAKFTLKKGLPTNQRPRTLAVENEPHSKVKANDTLDVKVIRCLEGAGKLAGSLGAMVVEGATGVESEIGSFQLTNEQRRWIWEHREVLTGQIAEVRSTKVNQSGAIRVFVRFHSSKSEQGLLLYSESLAGSTNPDESRPMMYRLKSSAGWRR